MKENDDIFLWKFGQMSRSRAYSAAAKGRGGIAMSAQYAAVLASMTTAPSAADQVIQATMLDALVTDGYYAKAEFIDIFATHTGGSLLNWKNPGTFNPSLVNAPAFEQYAGYTGANTKYINLNFNPTADASLMSQDSVCYIIGIGTDKNEAAIDFGATLDLKANVIYTRNSNTLYCGCNSLILDNTPNLNSIAHYAISRGANDKFYIYINTAKTEKSMPSSEPVNLNLYALCRNSAGSPGDYSTKQIRYAMGFSYLTEAEIQGVMTIMETYLDNYSKGLIA